MTMHGYKYFFGLGVVETRCFMVNVKKVKLERFYIKIQK